MPEQYVNGVLYDTVTGERVGQEKLSRNLSPQMLPGTAARSTVVPTSATASGEIGEIRFNTTHAFFCVARNTWRRCAIATW